MYAFAIMIACQRREPFRVLWGPEASGAVSYGATAIVVTVISVDLYVDREHELCVKSLPLKSSSPKTSMCGCIRGLPLA
jgi:hypothetical protein